MRRPRTLFVASSVVVLLHHSPGAAQNASEGTVRVRVEVLKPSTFERKVGTGPVLIGPQSALELEWRVTNQTGRPLEIPSPDAFLRLRLSAGGIDTPVRTEWSQTMTLRSGSPDNRMVLPQPVGAITLQGGSAVWVRGSAKTLNESPFAPGNYVVQLNVHDLRQISASGTESTPRIDAGFPIQLQIVAVDSPERRRQFHMTEGAFYRTVDPARALEHYSALAALPGAPWTDSLPLAEMYANLGRHGEASAVFRRILPDLIRSVDSPLAKEVPLSVHLRLAARSFAVEGDTATAANLLRVEGRTPPDRIPAEIDRLRKTAPSAGGNVK